MGCQRKCTLMIYGTSSHMHFLADKQTADFAAPIFNNVPTHTNDTKSAKLHRPAETLISGRNSGTSCQPAASSLRASCPAILPNALKYRSLPSSSAFLVLFLPYPQPFTAHFFSKKTIIQSIFHSKLPAVRQFRMESAFQGFAQARLDHVQGNV